MEIGSDSGSPQIVDTDEDTSSSSSQSSSSPLSFQALVRVPSSPTNTITNTLISRLEITDLRYDITCYGDFLRHIPARLGRNEALDTSADALATTFSTLHRPQGHQSVDALTKYVRALKSLRVVLSDPRKARTPETMCAVYLIMICQVGVPFSPMVPWLTRLRAGSAGKMISTRTMEKAWRIYFGQRPKRIGRPVLRQKWS